MKHFLSGVAWRLTQLLPGAKSPEEVQSAGTFFSRQNAMSTCLTSSAADKYRGMTVLSVSFTAISSFLYTQHGWLLILPHMQTFIRKHPAPSLKVIQDVLKSQRIEIRCPLTFQVLQQGPSMKVYSRQRR